MAEEQKTYPMLPVAHWWALRKKFKQSIPGVVTDSYLSTVLSMAVNSARGNILPYLKTLGIIDEEGKTGERARRWRDDEHYGEVCKEIQKEVYPAELPEAVPDPVEDRKKVERWFAQKTGLGTVAVGRMAVLYGVIATADASKQPDQERGERTKKDGKDNPKKTAKVELASPIPGTTVPAAPFPAHDAQSQQSAAPQAPGIYINLQVHISADSTPDQIDAIFASMAKHIYKRG
jgi:hypothetical protein